MNKLAGHFANDIYAHISCLNPARVLGKRCELPLPLPPKIPSDLRELRKWPCRLLALHQPKQTTAAYYYFIIFFTIVCSINFVFMHNCIIFL